MKIIVIVKVFLVHWGIMDTDVCANIQSINDESKRNHEGGKKYHLDNITAHDTFQRLNYESKIPFNELWQPREAVSIPVNWKTARKFLGDTNLQQVIKTRPRVYMSPGVNLDDVRDPEVRRSMVKFTYNTIARQANQDVWRDFEPSTMCRLADLKEGTKTPLTRSIHYLPPGMEKVAIPWEVEQERNLLPENSESGDKTVCCYTEKEIEKPESAVETKIEKLIKDDRLSTIYDKYPLSYGGYRSRVALGVPLEREELDFSHPNLPISKALYQYHKHRN